MKIVDSGKYLYEIKDFCKDIIVNNDSLYKNLSLLT